ncbi:NACHT-ANK domain protein transcript variant 1 [Tuber magnatum]|uniref:NACHT-ANK domain protein transcript variant 1 n=1 Tax=Tuber magnatum TaxID=42249 RepID=A0A317SLD8_9PEZI|nr:NACHT-ANK domain protein transcript variant 1 [Tuber magnatum]
MDDSAEQPSFWLPPGNNLNTPQLFYLFAQLIINCLSILASTRHDLFELKHPLTLWAINNQTSALRAFPHAKRMLLYSYIPGTDSSLRPAEMLQYLYTSRYEEHRRRVQKPVEGTCSWVMEHPKYKDWLEKKTSGLLWLSADPGCGKSAIASFLVGHLQSRPDTIVCYFFFKDDSDEQRSAPFALCAILHHIFRKRERLIEFAGEAFKARGIKFTQEIDTLWDILVKAVLEWGCGEVICVVDALDECEDGTLAPLIHHVTRLSGSQDLNIPLTLLVTSHPYHKIERDLGSPATTIRLKGEDELRAISMSVTRVIDDGIKNLESYWGKPGELGYLRNLLESSADRTFLWVSLVLDVLKDSEDDSREELTNIASTAPCDLAGLYTKILDKSSYPDKARLILSIVIAATGPLTLREMNIAFKMGRGRKSIVDLGELPLGFDRTVKNLCGLFVRVIDSKIYLVHQTAWEFLLKGSSMGQGSWQYTLCPKYSSFVLADACISYLSLGGFENDPFTVDAYANFECYRQKYAFLDYAAGFWAEHFRDSQDLQMELFEFTRLICETGSKRFLTWLQVYWSNFQWMRGSSWFGQGAVVERLLEEGGDINARCKRYGTALNIAHLFGETRI